MRIAQVLGNVTLNRCHPSFRNASLKLVVPLDIQDLAQEPLSPAGAETLVAWDQLGAGTGSLIALSEGPEAAQPFRPEIKPVDAYAAAILDKLNLEETLVRQLAAPDEE